MRRDRAVEVSFSFARCSRLDYISGLPGRALNTKKSREVLPQLNPQQNEVGVTP